MSELCISRCRECTDATLHLQARVRFGVATSVTRCSVREIHISFQHTPSSVFLLNLRNQI